MKALVVCGATASGKTALAVECAKRLNGEVISGGRLARVSGTGYRNGETDGTRKAGNSALHDRCGRTDGKFFRERL